MTYSERRSDALEGTRSLQRRTLLLGAGARLLVSALWWWLSGRVLRPVRDFHAAVDHQRCEDPWEFAAPLAADAGLRTTVTALARLLAALRGEIASARGEEERLRHVLLHAPDAVFSVDGEGLVSEWNRQAEVTFGWRKEEMLGRSALHALSPEHDHEQAHSRFEQHLDGRDAMVLSRDVEVPVLRRDGSRLTVEMSAATMGPASARQTTVFLRDVSARRTAQEGLLASERRLRMITDNLPAFIGYMDVDQVFRFISRNLANVGGMETQRLVGRSLLECLGAKTYAFARPHVEAGLRGETTRFEMQSISQPGRIYQVDYLPDVRDDGRVQGLYTMMLDISDERQAAGRLAFSEQRLREITDSVPGMILCLTPVQAISFCNETAVGWLGARSVGLLGRPLDEVLNAAAWSIWAPNVRTTLGGNVSKFDFMLVAPMGALELHTVLTPHRGTDGSVAGVYALSTDVTALKVVERQLQTLARFDPLTGLPNRRQFDERLSDLLGSGRRTGQSFALMFIDLDHFKSINDSLGHAGGDEVLKEVALRLEASLRETDIVARLGGDEFVAVLEGLASVDQAHGVANKVVAALRVPVKAQGQLLKVTASIGVVFHGGKSPVSAGALMEQADELLYVVKANGRDGFRVAVA